MKDAPSRGHDLKLAGGVVAIQRIHDAPSRGHDLKPAAIETIQQAAGDAPSRGHDLKRQIHAMDRYVPPMPPHGGMT